MKIKYILLYARNAEWGRGAGEGEHVRTLGWVEVAIRFRAWVEVNYWVGVFGKSLNWVVNVNGQTGKKCDAMV